MLMKELNPYFSTAHNSNYYILQSLMYKKDDISEIVLMIQTHSILVHMCRFLQCFEVLLRN